MIVASSLMLIHFTNPENKNLNSSQDSEIRISFIVLSNAAHLHSAGKSYHIKQSHPYILHKSLSFLQTQY